MRPDEIQVGMPVWWCAQGTRALIAQLPDANGRVLLEMGTMKARVPLSEVQRYRGETATTAPSTDRLSGFHESREAILPEIDLRGQRVDEAVAVVDKFIDDAILAGWTELRVIHGKGTGALRQSIGAFLAKHPRVSAARPAPLGEGDTGVTIVTLE
mgnify:CR=1 FL=1